MAGKQSCTYLVATACRALTMCRSACIFERLITQAKLTGSLARNLVAAGLLVVASSRCATYENNLPDAAGAGTAGSGGAGGESAAGGKPSTGGTPGASGSTSGSAPGGQPNGGSAGVAGVSGSGDPGDAGAGSVEGGAPSEGGQPASAGTGGNGGMGGKAGTGGMAGTGGGSPVLLSQGKPATSDSEQTSENHPASHANDGNTSTRWCAANSALNHYWSVDLGQSRTLTKVQLLWEKDFAYLFKIETSTDNSQWAMAVDKTTSSSASASQDHTLPANTNGRYVRITVTGGLQPSTWASLFEAQVFGY
jgi:hypothetical protein